MLDDYMHSHAKSKLKIVSKLAFSGTQNLHLKSKSVYNSYLNDMFQINLEIKISIQFVFHRATFDEINSDNNQILEKDFTSRPSNQV